MGSASFSSTFVSKRELLFLCPKRRSSDVFTLCPSFRNYCPPRMELLIYGKTPHKLSAVKQRTIRSGWRDYNQIPRKWNFDEWSSKKGKIHLVKAVATVEPDCLVRTENGQMSPSFQFDSSSDSQELYCSNDDSTEMVEKEKLRRMKISKANKGNVPWNKGKSHSPETLQLIRERTKIAMQDPKVKLKLMNLGHAQSEETRIKIGVGVREGWQRRREMLMVQESCFFEWQNFISEASRKGCADEDELQWDSYKILDEQLKREWLESIQQRRSMPRPKGSKRAPKSAEQRRKISEAITAKWADPDYRGRVCNALAKYHGIPVGGGRKRRRKPPGEASSEKREPTKRKPVQSNGSDDGSDDEARSTKKVPPRRKKRSTPSYKDPMASSKLEMIRNIRAERAAMENKKKEAIERAKLLIAEAEKAAKALEVAALKSPLARASLLETRKLISEATRSIESIESGQLPSQESRDEASDLDERIVNGSQVVPYDQKNYEGFDFEKVALDNAPKAEELSPSTSNREGSEPNNDKKVSNRNDLQVDQPKINGSDRYKTKPVVRDEEGTDKSKQGERGACATKTKKWVCGRLVEVED